MINRFIFAKRAGSDDDEQCPARGLSTLGIAARYDIMGNTIKMA